MNYCQCGGELLRHGVIHYKRTREEIGVRYRCRECKTTFTQRMPADVISGKLFFGNNRPTLKDWRFGVTE